MVLYTRLSASQKTDEEVYRYWLNQMPVDIRDRINKYRRWQDAESCLFGKVLLQLCFSRFYPSCSLNDLEYTRYNRPYIKNGAPYFNISHSGEYVVCVVSDVCEVGIDVEEIKDIEFDVYASQFLESEWQHVQHSSNRQKAFFHIWTQKEALTKANGKGLIIPLKSIHIDGKTGRVEGEKWYLNELSLSEQCVCHLATNIPMDTDSIILCNENFSGKIKLCSDCKSCKAGVRDQSVCKAAQ